MSITRRAIIAAVAALALGGSMVGSTAPADAHDYSREGTVSAKEANKLFKEVFKQKCLTVHEARHIVHGSGVWSWEESLLAFHGTKKSHIVYVSLDVSENCIVTYSAVKAR
jgi:hypothetical protein